MLNKKTVEYNNTIYVFNIHKDKNKTCYIIGKMVPRDYGTEIQGYVKDRKINKLFRGVHAWRKVRLATPDEIDKYIQIENTIKFNI